MFFSENIYTCFDFTSSCVPVCLSALMFGKFTQALPAILTLKCHLGNTKAILGSSSLNSGHTLWRSMTIHCLPTEVTFTKSCTSIPIIRVFSIPSGNRAVDPRRPRYITGQESLVGGLTPSRKALVLILHCPSQLVATSFSSRVMSL